MERTTTHWTWLTLGASAIAIALATILLTSLLRLEPCYLCIFQRLIFMLIGIFAFATAIAKAQTVFERILGVSTILITAAGLTAALYQTWLQQQPPDTVSCIGGQPGPIETLVEALGQVAPSLFMATGFCEDDGLVFLGLTLANWSAVAFTLILGLATWTLWAHRGSR